MKGIAAGSGIDFEWVTSIKINKLDSDLSFIYFQTEGICSEFKS